MTHNECEKRADEFRVLYNPDNLTPFPFQNVEKECSDLDILVFPFDGEEIKTVSGATVFNAEDNSFSILINGSKPATRQNFTIAHELGHYFLHKDILKEEGVIVDDDKDRKILYRIDDVKRSQIEIEADNFAAALLMPKNLVIEAWNTLKNVQDCAKVFSVSSLAMSIRLERLNLLNE